MILAIDTAHEFGSLALYSSAGLLEEFPLHSPDGFAHILFPSLEALLARHQLDINQISAFAAGIGPGSFTGLRVALTTAKGLGEATSKPVFGVSNLAALAAQATSSLAAPFYDARRGEVYAALPDGTEFVAPFLDFLARLAPNTELLSFDFAPFPVSGWKTTLLSRSLAATIARLAYLRYQAGERPDAMLLDANYVRRSDAELHWKEA